MLMRLNTQVQVQEMNMNILAYNDYITQKFWIEIPKINNIYENHLLNY